MTDSVDAFAATDAAWLRPSPRLGSLRRTEVAGLTAAAALVVAALAALAAFTGSRTALPAGAGGLVAIGLLGLAGERFAQRRVRAWAYSERAEDLLVRRGVLISRLSVIPYGRMQFIDVVAGPLERLYGLATVRMHTAAAASDARIPGLGREEAARLRDHLAELGESRAAGL